MLETSAGPATAPPQRGRVVGEPAGLSRDAAGLSGQAILSMLHRRIGPLLACFIAIPCLAYVALRQTAPRFTATGTVIYDPNEYKPRELQSILRVDPTTQATMASQAEVLRSLNSVERVVTELDLFGKPEFNPALRSPSLPDRFSRWLRGCLA